MAIDDDAGDGVGTAVVDSPSTKPAVIAQLTWAKLYTKAMHKDIGTISTAIRKTHRPLSDRQRRKARRNYAISLRARIAR